MAERKQNTEMPTPAIDPAVTNQQDEMSELKQMVAQVIKKNSELAEENLSLSAQVKSLQTGGSPSIEEQERQRQKVAEASKLNYVDSSRKHAVILRIAPKGVKDNDRKQVVYKRAVGPFKTAQKPDVMSDRKTVSPRSKAMIVADYNSTIGANLKPEDVILEVA